MKKLLFVASTIAMLGLAGCQQLKQQADSLSQQSANTINGFSQQAEGVRSKVLETKAAYDVKAKEVQDTLDDVNKLTH